MGEPTMTFRDVRGWIDAEPFQPFRIVMTDGKSFDITNPMLVWPGANTVMVGFPAQKDPDAHDHHRTLSMSHIVRLEPMAISAPQN
jgi:hypothetical protein